jgi:hypothetical protein
MDRINRVEAIQRQTLENPLKDKEQTIRWRGRKVVIRKNASFAWSGGEDVDEGKESPIQLLLKLLQRSK